MSKSIFLEKSIVPGEKDVQKVLNTSITSWNNLRQFMTENYDNVSEEWNFPGKNYGWSMRIKIKKRNIIYMVPHDGYFNVAFVFGPKAYEVILKSDLSEHIKNDLKEARVYMEGRGIRLDIHQGDSLKDIENLIRIKVDN